MPADRCFVSSTQLIWRHIAAEGKGAGAAELGTGAHLGHGPVAAGLCGQQQAAAAAAAAAAASCVGPPALLHSTHRISDVP